jgi:hypothetical protein
MTPWEALNFPLGFFRFKKDRTFLPPCGPTQNIHCDYTIQKVFGDGVEGKKSPATPIMPGHITLKNQMKTFLP